MNGSAIVGEASDTSAFEMDGVTPPDGGTVFGHYVNAAGNDGLLMSEQLGCVTIGSNNVFDRSTLATLTAGHITGSAAMTFDQTTLQITNPSVTTSPDCDSQPRFSPTTSDCSTIAARAPSPRSQASHRRRLHFSTLRVRRELFRTTSSSPPVYRHSPIYRPCCSAIVRNSSAAIRRAGVASFFGTNVFGLGFDRPRIRHSRSTSIRRLHHRSCHQRFRLIGRFRRPWAVLRCDERNVGYYAIATRTTATTPATILAVDYTASRIRLISTSGVGLGTATTPDTVRGTRSRDQKLLFVNDSTWALQSGADRPAQFHIIDLLTRSVMIVTPPRYAADAISGGDGRPGQSLVCGDRTQRADDVGRCRNSRPPSISSTKRAGWYTTSRHHSPIRRCGGTGPGYDLTYVNGRQTAAIRAGAVQRCRYYRARNSRSSTTDARLIGARQQPRTSETAKRNLARCRAGRTGALQRTHRSNRFSMQSRSSRTPSSAWFAVDPEHAPVRERARSVR